MTAFVTRPSQRGIEVLVFEHPKAGIQFPAGTLVEGETARDGVLRETWEETGVREFTDVRHLRDRFWHLPLAEQVSDEWFVVTPDGGGLCWRCHWIDVNENVLHPHQQPWLEEFCAALLAREDATRELRHPIELQLPRPREEAEESFWATQGLLRRFLLWRVPLDEELPVPVSRCHGVCRTVEGGLVLVSGGETWGMPGGGIEPGETPREAFIREVAEECCAAVLDVCPVEYLLGVGYDETGILETFAFMLFSAVVELEAWQPQFEISRRKVVSLPDLHGGGSDFTPLNLAFVEAALTAL